MEFKQIEAFVNVIKYKSFSKAADASFLTQPTISTHISSLEKELGVTLIDRMGKESRPTKEGRAFYKYAINLINTREKALMEVGNAGNELSGIVDIRASSIPGQYIVPELMTGFRKLFPSVRFYLEQSDSETVWNGILENDGEIWFTGDYKNNGLKYDLLYKDPLILITPKNDKFLKLREKSEYISKEDFFDENFVWREEGSATRSTFEEMVCTGRNRRLNIVATVNSLESIKRCVTGGLGISVLSQTVVNKDANIGYLSFKLSDLNLKREFYLVTNKNVTLSPTAKKFKEFVLGQFNR